MPVRSIKNQYLGVNAHLHSLWQAKGRWNFFHNRHIGDLSGFLRQKLLPMGYEVIPEESLQVRRIGETSRHPRADILITDLKTGSWPQAETAEVAPFTVAELVPEEDFEKPYYAIAIYEQDDIDVGEPVAWIELLSPSNKGFGQDASIYQAKRYLLLKSGLVYVEIDYLNDTPPTFDMLTTTHPYRIVVLDARPDMQSGPAKPYEFSVDEVIPTAHIPLNGNDVIDFDFNAAYIKTYEEMLYGFNLVDYSQLPLNFERYTPADQARIANRMLAVLEAARAGVDLESGPFPVRAVPLDEALAQIDALNAAAS